MRALLFIFILIQHQLFPLVSCFEVVEGPAKLLWATLVAEYEVKGSDETTRQLGELAERAWNEFHEHDRKKAASDGNNNKGDRFYAYQVKNYQRLYNCKEFEWLKEVMAKVMGRALETFYNLQITRDQKANIFCWATYGGGDASDTFHPPHFHRNSVLSAVFYVSAPPTSAPLTLMDPRTGTGNIHELQPREGLVTVFPSTLLHYIGNSPPGARRISYSCNLPGQTNDPWMETSSLGLEV